MKTFKDLEFKKRDNFISIQATMVFDNGYKLSVVAGSSAYCSPREDNTDPDFFESFEVGVFNSDKELTREFFPSDHNDDVMGWQSRADINTLMLQIQSK
jgi:hypothetical protein